MPDVGGINSPQLRSFIERAERLHEEKKALEEDLKELWAECRGVGFDSKICKKIIRMRAADPDKLDEEEAMLDLYMRALGMRGTEDANARDARGEVEHAA